MKKVLSVLLICALICGALVFTACGESGGGKKADVDEKNLSFTTVGDVKSAGSYEFISADGKVEEDKIVCTIKADAEGELTIPAEYDGKEVVALTAEADSSDKVTAITIESGVSFIENCYKTSSAVAKLTLPDTVKGVFHSFNGCELTELSFPAETKYITDAFNSCAKLAEIETTGYVHGISESFKDDAALAAVTIGGSIQKIDKSFDNCGVTSLDFVDNVHGMSASFNACPALTSVTFEQITGSIFTSFNQCKALKELTYKQGGEMINKSFNENEVLEKVDFGGGIGNISGAFKDCPKYTLPEEYTSADVF